MGLSKNCLRWGMEGEDTSGQQSPVGPLLRGRRRCSSLQSALPSEGLGKSLGKRQLQNRGLKIP